MSSSWILLIIAGLLEVCWSVGLKYTDGFTKLKPTIFTLTTLCASMYLLARASATLPIGTAYGVWVGIGAMGAAVLGMVLFDEPASAARIAFLVLMLISIVGLKVTSH
ncbi:MAG: quaternary ammonium compound efflux SMR transporter SugE [Edaphobacter sp.]|uniref:quaternary ammonium compound efflux SMR transporter SugE n=1 Tax=Edaphobacter sp. TaxID=1934404 RepID=UPI0023872D9A|nr:quaternary ammonium compound efflux SMR transporter SugE [Edaphobacter sp.]MDE1178802.1 quaternary ammonium compound efflux SMR transporter SugE [Edaphobacter sp.]